MDDYKVHQSPSSRTADCTILTRGSSAMKYDADEEEDFHQSCRTIIDDEFMEELRELGLSPTIVIDKSVGSQSHDYDSSSSHDYSDHWGDQSYLGDLMNQRENRETLQREEIMEEALERFNAIPDIVNKKTGEKKSSNLFLKLVEQVQEEMEEEFRKRNQLQDERIANELLAHAERLREQKSEEARAKQAKSKGKAGTNAKDVSLKDVEEEDEDEEESEDESESESDERFLDMHEAEEYNETYSPPNRRSSRNSSSQRLSLEDSHLMASSAPSSATSGDWGMSKSRVSMSSDDKGMVFDDAASSSSDDDSDSDSDVEIKDAASVSSSDSSSSSGSSSSGSSSSSSSSSDSSSGSSSSSSSSSRSSQSEIEMDIEVVSESEPQPDSQPELRLKPISLRKLEPKPKPVENRQNNARDNGWTLIQPSATVEEEEFPQDEPKAGDDRDDRNSRNDVSEPGIERGPGAAPEVDPSKLGFWGREVELDTLRSRFLTAIEPMGDLGPASAAPKHVWVTGIPGIGKSSLVEAFLQQNVVVKAQPFVCRGSFEESWVDTSNPFSGILSCFSDLFESFLSRHDTEKWAEIVQNSFSDVHDVEILVLLIPSLGELLDLHIEDAEYGFDKTDNFSFDRLSRALSNVLIATCKESSIVFAIDNVHLAGDDSLRLLKALLLTENLKNFFFVGSHRSGIKVTHLLPKVKTEVSSMFGPDIKLRGIDKPTAKAMVQHRLLQLHEDSSISTKVLNSFVDTWYSHASCNNPLFLDHLLRLLYEKKSLKFKGIRWTADLNADLPSSLENLVEKRIEALPEKHDLLLQSAAFLDANNFRTETLMAAVKSLPGSPKLEIDIKEAKTILDFLAEKKLVEKRSADCYGFAHDVFRTAAASRIPAASKKKTSRMHWRLATKLKAMPNNGLAETGSLIAKHLEKGIASIQDQNQIEIAVKLFLRLGEAAMKRSAFVTAIKMLEIGMAALDKKSKWEDSYQVTRQTHLTLAQCLYCMGDLDRAKSLLNTLVANAHPPRDTIDAFDLLIAIFRSRMQYEQAKECAMKALTDIWNDDLSEMNVEEKFSKVRQLVQNKSDADLLVLSDMEHKKIAKKMPFLLQLAEISGLCRDYKLQDLAALRMLELTLRYGSYETNFTGLVFALCGLGVARRRLYGEAYRYGRLAEMMAEIENPLGRQAIAHHSYSLRHWRNTLKNSRRSLGELCKAALDSNEVENLSFQVGAYLSTMLYTGSSVNHEDDILKLYNRTLDLPESWIATVPYNALMKLKGEKLVKKTYTDTKAMQYEIFFDMVTSVFLHDMDKAGTLSAKIFVKPGGCWGPYRVFMEGLIATHFAQVSEGKKKILRQKEATKFVNILTTFTKKGMNNSAHMANILKVELTLASDRALPPKRTSILVDTAIASAYQDGFPHHAALASERAGLYFLRNDNEKLACKYLSRAVSLYKEWGVQAKVKQLETGHRKYLRASPPPLPGMQRTSACSLMFSDRNQSVRDVSRNSMASRRSSIASRGSLMASRRSLMSSRRSLMSSLRDLSCGSPNVGGRPVGRGGPQSRLDSGSELISDHSPSASKMKRVSDPESNSQRKGKRSSLFSLSSSNTSPKLTPESKTKRRSSIFKNISLRQLMSSTPNGTAENPPKQLSSKSGDRSGSTKSRNTPNGGVRSQNQNGGQPGGKNRAGKAKKHNPTAAPLSRPKKFLSKPKVKKKKVVNPDYDNWVASSYMMKYNGEHSDSSDDEKPSKTKAPTKKHVSKKLGIVKKKKPTKAEAPKSDDKTCSSSSMEGQPLKKRQPQKQTQKGKEPKDETSRLKKPAFGINGNGVVKRPKEKAKVRSRALAL